MYVNRFFVTREGNAFALWQITETSDPLGTAHPELFAAADGTSLWCWGSRLYWTYKEVTESVRAYATSVEPLTNTIVDLVDLCNATTCEIPFKEIM